MISTLYNDTELQTVEGKINNRTYTFTVFINYSVHSLIALRVILNRQLFSLVDKKYYVTLRNKQFRSLEYATDQQYMQMHWYREAYCVIITLRPCYVMY